MMLRQIQEVLMAQVWLSLHIELMKRGMRNGMRSGMRNGKRC